MTNRKNLVILLNAFWNNGKGISGGDQIAKQVFNRIGNHFGNIFVLTSNEGYKLFDQIPNATHIKYGNFVESKGLAMSYVFRTLIGTFKLLKRRADIIYTGSDFFPDVIPSFIYKFKNKKATWYQSVFHIYPHWKTRQGSKLKAFFGYYLQKVSLILIKNADYIICINTQVKNALLNKGVKENQLILVYPGIDYQELAKTTPSPKRYHASFLARLNPSKGVYDLPKIWSLVCKKIPEARLAVIGGGSKEVNKQLTDEVAEAKLEKNIDLLGFLENEEAFGIVKSSSVFIFPSHEEGFGIAVAEAMACGTPTVAWDLPVYNEVFEDKIVQVQENNFDKFAQGVIGLLENPPFHDKISQESAEYVKRYSWDSVAEQYLKCLVRI